MKRFIILIIFIFSSILKISSQSNPEFLRFKNTFSELELPHITLSDYLENKSFKAISKDLSLEFLCDRDTNNLKFHYTTLDVYPCDTCYRYFGFYAIGYFKYKNLFYFLYYRAGNAMYDNLSDIISMICFDEKGEKLFEEILNNEDFYYLQGILSRKFCRINVNGTLEFIEYINNIKYDTEGELIDKKIQGKTIIKYSKYELLNKKILLLEEKNYPGRHYISDYLDKTATDDYAWIFYKIR